MPKPGGYTAATCAASLATIGAKWEPAENLTARLYATLTAQPAAEQEAVLGAVASLCNELAKCGPATALEIVAALGRVMEKRMEGESSHVRE
jgi:hypothetical protein